MNKRIFIYISCYGVMPLLLSMKFINSIEQIKILKIINKNQLLLRSLLDFKRYIGVYL